MAPQVTQEIVRGLKETGIDFISYLPETWLHDVYDAILADPHFKVVLGANEGECVSICAGAWLGGRRAAVIMENSGLRVATETLARLGIGHGIPVLMIMPFRGDLGDKDWWAQAHGVTMKPLLEVLRIPYRIVEHVDEIAPTIRNAWETMHASKYPVSVIIGGRLCQ